MSGFRELACAHLGVPLGNDVLHTVRTPPPAVPPRPRHRSEPALCNRWTPKGPCQLISGHSYAHDGISGAPSRVDAFEFGRIGTYTNDDDEDIDYATCKHCKKKIESELDGPWRHTKTGRKRCTTLKAEPESDTRYTR